MVDASCDKWCWTSGRVVEIDAAFDRGCSTSYGDS